MSVFYVIIISNLYQKRKEVYEGDISNYMQMYKSISRTLSILILVYILFLTPLSLYLLFEQEYKWPPQNKFFLYMGYIHDYGAFWLFATNALVYLATNSRIREAYRTFMKDMWKKIFKQTNQTPDTNLTETSTFWIILRKIS